MQEQINYDELIDYNKKGVLVIGSPRSGSHMAGDFLCNSSRHPSKFYRGEIFSNQKISYNETLLTLINDSRFVFCSIVQYWAKNILAINPVILKDYQLINIRRRNKIKQYISWCVFRTQVNLNISMHSPTWQDVKNFLPWNSTEEDLDQFINEQHLDFAFNCDKILYYEDLIVYNLPTNYNKNIYPISDEEIVTNYTLVESKLKNYSYDNR